MSHCPKLDGVYIDRQAQTLTYLGACVSKDHMLRNIKKFLLPQSSRFKKGKEDKTSLPDHFQRRYDGKGGRDLTRYHHLLVRSWMCDESGDRIEDREGSGFGACLVVDQFKMDGFLTKNISITVTGEPVQEPLKKDLDSLLSLK